MKKKIVSICLVVALAATAIVGGTLAYFTDTDSEENVFTTGNVDIDLEEVFDEENAKLMPGIDIQKEVTVKNVGTENAYVRVHIAYPSMLDSGSEDQPQFAAYNNMLHWNFTADSVQEGEWSQLQNKDQVGPNASYPNWPGNGGTYNFYQTTVDGILYNVYVYTYETVLESGEETATPAISNVYLDTKVTNEQMAEITDVLGNNPKILVFAEGGQEAGFTDAYTALNTQFGDPMAEGYVSPWNQE